MRWFGRQRDACATAEAEAAAIQARRALHDARNFSRRAEELADRLNETRRRNHFAEAVAKAIRGV